MVNFGVQGVDMDVASFGKWDMIQRKLEEEDRPTYLVNFTTTKHCFCLTISRGETKVFSPEGKTHSRSPPCLRKRLKKLPYSVESQDVSVGVHGLYVHPRRITFILVRVGQ